MKPLISPLVTISGRIKNLSIIAHGMSRSKRASSGEKGSPVSCAVPWALPGRWHRSEAYRQPSSPSGVSSERPNSLSSVENSDLRLSSDSALLWVSKCFCLNLALPRRSASILVNYPGGEVKLR